MGAYRICKSGVRNLLVATSPCGGFAGGGGNVAIEVYNICIGV